MKRSALPLVRGRRGRVRLCRMSEPCGSASACSVRAVGGAVVGQHSLDAHAASGEALERARAGSRSRSSARSSVSSFDVGETAVVVDADVDVLVAGRLLEASRAAAEQAMPGRVEASELLDVDVDELARPSRTRTGWAARAAPAASVCPARSASRSPRQSRAASAGSRRSPLPSSAAAAAARSPAPAQPLSAAASLRGARRRSTSPARPRRRSEPTTCRRALAHTSRLGRSRDRPTRFDPLDDATADECRQVLALP